jgi:3',5'-cyclic AMP phosphodiesterase CpdA
MKSSGRIFGLVALVACALVAVLLISRDSSEPSAARISTKVLPAAKPSKNPVVAAVGDIACPAGDPTTASSCQQQAVSDAIVKSDPTSVWLLGDIQYLNGELDQFRESFGKAFAPLRKRWRPTPGNHEYATTNAAGYYEFFGKRAGPYRRGFYSFDIGSWHVVSLNANCTIIDCTAKSFQARWLRNDLKKHPSRCTAAIWHQPLFSSGVEHGNDPLVRPLWQILQNNRADLVLNGHDHDFEEFSRQDAYGRPDPKGMIEFVSGAGGKSWYQFGKVQPNSKVRIGNTFGFLKLKLKQNSFDWSYVTKDNKVPAHGSARCV